jgi:hypothetical protein
VYAHLLGSGEGPARDGSIFILRDARMITTRKGLFPEAMEVEGPPLDVTLAALDRAVSEQVATLARGEVVCAGTPEDPEDVYEESKLDEDGVLRLPPGCLFCEYRGLCRREGE